jgi:hypothetical protein
MDSLMDKRLKVPKPRMKRMVIVLNYNIYLDIMQTIEQGYYAAYIDFIRESINEKIEKFKIDGKIERKIRSSKI